MSHQPKSEGAFLVDALAACGPDPQLTVAFRDEEDGLAISPRLEFESADGVRFSLMIGEDISVMHLRNPPVAGLANRQAGSDVDVVGDADLGAPTDPGRAG